MRVNLSLFEKKIDCGMMNYEEFEKLIEEDFDTIHTCCYDEFDTYKTFLEENRMMMLTLSPDERRAENKRRTEETETFLEESDRRLAMMLTLSPDERRAENKRRAEEMDKEEISINDYRRPDRYLASKKFDNTFGCGCELYDEEECFCECKTNKTKVEFMFNKIEEEMFLTMWFDTVLIYKNRKMKFIIDEEENENIDILYNEKKGIIYNIIKRSKEVKKQKKINNKIKNINLILFQSTKLINNNITDIMSFLV